MLQAYAQRRVITGSVEDEKGVGIPGASIVLEGTTIGTTTDIDGNFSLNVEGAGGAIIVSFIGYDSQRIELGNQTKFTISLKISVASLDEVVVVGYGSQRKVSVVGSISNVNSKELSNVATANISNALAGRVSGVIVKMGEGRPGGDDPLLSIRGASTINDISPLVLIDGMEGDLNRINPNDIESFSVLKDASATAVYGVRGANGVILITTKRGLLSRPEININGQYRLHSIINFPEAPGSYDFARLYNEALINVGSKPYYSAADLEHYRTGDSPYTHPDVNWYNEIIAPYFPEQRYDVSLRGGTENVKYFVAGEYLTQQGAYKQWDDMAYSTNASYNRFNLRMNFDFKLTKTTDLGVNLNGRIQDTKNIQQGNVDYPGMWNEINKNPPNLTPLINPDGSIGASGLDENGAYANLRAGSTYTVKNNDLNALLNLNQRLDFITKGLGLRLKAGINTSLDYTFKISAHPATFIYNPNNETYIRAQSADLPNYVISNNHIANNPYIETAVTYDRAFGQHKFTGLALYNQDKKSSNANPWTAHRGFAGRVTYSLQDKYLGEINLGYNGSTQFEKQKRYAFLPAVSAGWILSEENFFKTTFPQIDFFKIRGSYGMTGNDKIGDYKYLYLAVFESSHSIVEYKDFNYRFGDSYTVYPTLIQASLANEKVSWEIAKKQNYGFDMRLFNGLLDLGFDYFFEKRSNILAIRNTITQVLGLQKSQLPAENFGRVNNRGFEIEANLRKTFGDFTVTASGNFSRAKNKIIDIDEVKYDLDYKNQTGKSIGQYFGYTWSGEYYTFEELGYKWDESVAGANKYVLHAGDSASVPVPTTPVYPGDLKFVDRNNDGIIDNYDIGAVGKTSRPEYIYGLNYTLKYKNLALNMFWQGAGGFSGKFGGGLVYEFSNNGTIHEMHLNRWAYYEDPFTGELIDTRATATYPRLVIGASSETQKTSTFGIFRADYLRLKNIELSYELPMSVLNPLRMKNARLFLMANNVLTFTDIKWIDPETPSKSSNESVYPQTRFIGAGINIGF